MILWHLSFVSATIKKASNTEIQFLQLKWPKIAGGIKIYTNLDWGKQKKHHNWKEKGTQFQAKNNFSQPANIEGG